MTFSSVVLASGSPRRRELLARMGIAFVVDAADVDEDCKGPPADVVAALARRKAEAVAPRHPGGVILAADTVVYLDEILGKPGDEAEARAMLRRLSGRWHEVLSGVCVLRDGVPAVGVETTRVHFTPMSEGDIGRYVETGDPMDKAGAYAIQGMSGMFIDRVEGCPHNVMGLPMALTRRLLAGDIIR